MSINLINSVLFEIPYIEHIGEHKIKTTRTIFYEYGIGDDMYEYHQFGCGWIAEPYGTYAT